jgi:hypothetical protein
MNDHHLPELPEEGSTVTAYGTSERFKDKIGLHKERCVLRCGKFMAGGDWPIPPFELNNVENWKYI